MYLAEVARAAGAKLDDWLNSNLVSRAAFDCAQRDDYDGFLNARAESIHEEVRKHTGW